MMASNQEWKIPVEEYTSLKDKVSQLKQEITTANKRIKELEPDVKKVIIAMYDQRDGPEDMLPILLFQEKRKVIELKTRKKSTPLNLRTLEGALLQYLESNPSCLIDVPLFISFWKQIRKAGGTQYQIIHYRTAKLSELSEIKPTKGNEKQTDEDSDDISAAIRL